MALLELGDLTVEELVVLTGVRRARVLGILFGGSREYAMARALVPLGLVLPRGGEPGMRLGLSPEGAAEARLVLALRLEGRPV